MKTHLAAKLFELTLADRDVVLCDACRKRLEDGMVLFPGDIDCELRLVDVLHWTPLPAEGAFDCHNCEAW